MKRLVVIASIALMSLGLTQTQRPPYRVVFDLTSRDTLDQKAVLRWIKETAGVQEAMKNPNVAFKVCAISLKNNSIEKSQLLAGVQTVPDGIYEVVTKQ